MKHFISLLDFTHEELVGILDRADYLATAWRNNQMPRSLKNKNIGLWFYGNGFRNRLAFELGAKALGADVSYIPGELGIDEPLQDIGYYLQNWYHALIIRAKCHQDLTYLSEYIKIPIINAKTEFSHPCEVMGDLQFIRRERKSLEGLKVVFVGEVTNLCMSWFEAAVGFPIQVTQVAPENYLAKDRLIKNMNAKALGEITVTSDLDSCIKYADIVYTDCWPHTSNEDEKEMIKKLFLPYQITGSLLKKTHDRSLFLPCPPVTRGQEVSEDAMLSKFCKNYEDKDYLLHSQNAILEFICS